MPASAPNHLRRLCLTGVLGAALLPLGRGTAAAPYDGTAALAAAGAADLHLIPFVRPYRHHGDHRTWFDDPAIADLVERLMAHAPGVGLIWAHTGIGARLRNGSRSCCSATRRCWASCPTAPA